MKMPSSENITEIEYLSKVNLWMLLTCFLHVPIIAGIAYYFETGVALALILGAVIAAGPTVLFLSNKASRLTSIALGIAMMSYSALLIHHARGMIEMHFHIFTFLAVLIIFANPWVIVAAATTVAVHHISFFFLLPKSVFNYEASFAIVLVHALFVVIETVPAIVIANSFKKFILAQGSIVKNLDTLSDQILHSANEAAESGSSLSQNAKEQAYALDTTVSAITEVGAMIQKSADNAARSKDISEVSKKTALGGKDNIDKMITAIKEIDECNYDMTSQFNQLNEQLNGIVQIIGEIGNKTNVINEIVFQTKLLSFNASVEAARAGEHGKGFAVVAEEVGNLAAMSGNASHEINNMLKSSIEKVGSIVTESRTKITHLSVVSNQKIKAGELTAMECQQSLNEISRTIEETIALMTDINNSALESSRGVEQISEAIKKLNDVTAQNTQSAELSADTAQALKEKAHGIKEVVEHLIKMAG